VMMGARMNLQVFDPTTAAGRTTLTIGGLLFVVALIGKVLGGLSVPGRGTKRWTVGIGMIPRGEVGLIFASIGLSKHVINDALYAAIILVVILTTFITPPLLKLAASRPGPKGGVQPAQRPESPLPGSLCGFPLCQVRSFPMREAQSATPVVGTAPSVGRPSAPGDALNGPK